MKDDLFRTNNFDLLRIMAATQVLILHTLQQFSLDKTLYFAAPDLISGSDSPPVYFTWLHYFPGVPIFFVMSGFLISASYERNSNLFTYLRNRLLRIYPGLWMCILLTVLAASFFGFDFLHKEGLVWIGAQMAGIIYTPGFLKSFGFGSYNGSLWTIIVELQFYIVVPVVYLLARVVKNVDAAVITIFVSFLAIAIYVKMNFPNLNGFHEVELSKLEKLFKYTFIPHFYLFMAGAVMQRLRFYQSIWIRGKGFWWLGLYMVVSAFTFHIPALSAFVMLLLGVAVVSLAYTGVGLAERILRGNDISYGIYIYHGLILNIFISLNLKGEPVYLVGVFLISVLLAYLSWMFIEKPALRKKGSSIKPAETSSELEAYASVTSQ